jgi:peptide/nickel transport system permease protein
MTRYITVRVIQGAVTLAAASLVVFALVRLRGDPAAVLLPLDATPEETARLRERLGLDDSIITQYVRFVTAAVTGDFGDSIRSRRPVTDLIGPALVRSIQLAVPAVVVSVGLGVPLGVAAARKPGRLFDMVGRGLTLLGQSVPSFLMGIVLIAVFAGRLGWLPPARVGGVDHFVLPVATLVFSGFLLPGVVRFTRAGMGEALDTEFVRLARARGVSERRVVWRHGLKNAALPLVTFVGVYAGLMLGGATLLTELIFAWPGLGTLLHRSITGQDFPVVQAVSLLLIAVFVVVNLIVDILYAYLDPRIRYS